MGYWKFGTFCCHDHEDYNSTNLEGWTKNSVYLYSIYSRIYVGKKFFHTTIDLDEYRDLSIGIHKLLHARKNKFPKVFAWKNKWTFRKYEVKPKIVGGKCRRFACFFNFAFSSKVVSFRSFEFQFVFEQRKSKKVILMTFVKTKFKWNWMVFFCKL